MKIKKGCVARCNAGFLGLVTSNAKVKTKDGEVWVGIHLSPDKAGNKWTSKNPELIKESVDSLVDYFFFSPEPS